MAIGASKAATSKFANKIISMMDSKEKTQSLIKQMTENLARPNQTEEQEVDAMLTLEDLHVVLAQLEQRIEHSLNSLTGTNASTKESILMAIRDDYLGKRLKAYAILTQVHQKVKQSLLAAVPYKRRISRAKKGTPAAF
jgi:tryptophanyl-tRNA synthetase